MLRFMLEEQVLHIMQNQDYLRFLRFFLWQSYYKKVKCGKI